MTRRTFAPVCVLDHEWSRGPRAIEASVVYTAARVLVRLHGTPVGSVVVPVLDPASGRMKLLRLSRREASERRRRNEERIQALLNRFTAYGLEPVLLSTTDPDEIFRAFLSWAEQRMYGVGVRVN